MRVTPRRNLVAFKNKAKVSLRPIRAETNITERNYPSYQKYSHHRYSPFHTLVELDLYHLHSLIERGTDLITGAKFRDNFQSWATF